MNQISKMKIILILLLAICLSSCKEDIEFIEVSQLVKYDPQSLELPKELSLSGYYYFKLFPMIYSSKAAADTDQYTNAVVVFSPNVVLLKDCEKHNIVIHGTLKRRKDFGNTVVLTDVESAFTIIDNKKINCSAKIR